MATQDPNPVRLHVQSTSDTEGLEKLDKAIDKTSQSAAELEAAEKKRAENEKAHAEWLADHQRRQEEYARKRVELESQTQQAVEKTAATVKKAAEVTKEGRGFAGMLDGSPERTDELKKQADAIEEQVEALEDLTDAEAGVIDARKRNTEQIDEQTKKLDRLVVSQGLAQSGEFFKNLGEGLGDAAEKLESVNPKLAETAKQAANASTALGSVLAGAGAGAALGGPVGAGIGALVAAISTVASAWLDAEAAAVEAEKNMADAINRSNRALAEQRGLRAADEIDRWVESLRKEETALQRVNREYEAGIALLRARRNAQAEIDSASDALELAKIDASEMSEEEKIRARAGVAQRAARRRAQDQITGINEDDQASAAKAQAARADSNNAANLEGKLKLKLQELIYEAMQLEHSGTAGQPLPPEVQKRIDELRGDGNGSIKKLQEELDEARKQALDAKKAAEEAERRRAIERQENEERARGVSERFRIESETRGISTGSSAGQARERAEEQRQREEDRQAKQREREQGRTGSSGFSDSANRLKQAVETAGTGDTANAMREATGALRELGGAFERQGQEMAALKRENQLFRKEIEQIKGRIRRDFSRG